MGIDSLIPLGLILNETISNAIKRAIGENNSGTTRLKMHHTSNQTFLSISDDGPGSSLNIEDLKSQSLGIELIQDLTEQLDGELNLTTNEGFSYQFIFPRLK